jgi:hypothetical protein
MRWIDIILPEPKTHQMLDSLLAEAAENSSEIPVIQERDGLDSGLVVKQMAKVGHLLFQAITTFDPQAFSPVGEKVSSVVPQLGNPEHDELVGFHLVIHPEWSHLPWNWLHNGLDFLLDKNPVVTSTHGSSLPATEGNRPWMQRCRRAEFLVGPDGSTTLASTLDQLRPDGVSSPEFLFVPGHMDEKIRRMIYREAEAIEAAIGSTHLSQPLARIHLPQTPVTPGDLCSLSLTFQALHFAGPVSHPAGGEAEDEPDWMDKMVQDMNALSDQELESAVGLEGEVLGVDPITSLLDDVSQKYDQEQLAGSHGFEKTSQEKGSSSSAGQDGSAGQKNGKNGSSPWLLDDGPVDPESLGKAGGIPPLVYSNSYRALPELGQRFLAAGASTFIGPVVPLFSRPARIYSGYFYQALGEGWCAGAAMWKASRSCRQELGKEHPAWLSYGVHGYGTLALTYL